MYIYIVISISIILYMFYQNPYFTLSPYSKKQLSN